MVTKAINAILNKHGDAVITNTNFTTNLDNDAAPDYIDYNCKLEVDFDLTTDDGIVIDIQMLDQIEDRLTLNDIDTYYTDA